MITTRIPLATVALASAVLASALQAQACPAGAAVLLSNATLLTMDDETLVPGASVLVEGGRITSVTIAPAAALARAGVCRVDAGGRVLMPGLADMHAHTDSSELPIFLANGVTLVREMNGTPGMVTLRERIARGEVLGPRLLVASPLLVGEALRYRHLLIKTPEEARKAARDAKAVGYDYLKVYDALSRESYDALVEEAQLVGIPLDGHVPSAVGLARVLETGQSLQHADKSAFALGGMSGDTASYAEARRLFRGRRTWFTPTLASLRALDIARTVEYSAAIARPEMAYVDDATMGWWRSLSGERPAKPRTPFYRYETGLMTVLRGEGVRFLLGTDAANPLMVAGFSVHDELAALVADGGFTPFEALQSATRNVGEFLGEPLAGRLVVGAPADLILVDGDPLTSLATLRRPAGVMLRGRWLSRAELDAMLAERRVR
jgi:imidazolonepropionase-like amidohydrolase